jgi:hypothetical protein
MSALWQPWEERMTDFVPPLEFGNRAFYGLQSRDGHVVVIDSPREIDRSDVPIDPPRDVVVHAAYMAAPVATQLLRRGFRGFIGVDAGIGRNAAGIGGLPLADAHSVPAAAISVYSCDMCAGASVWADGVISSANASAAALGVQPGQSTAEAAALMLRAPPGQARELHGSLPDADFPLQPAPDSRVFGCWSMSLVHGERTRDVFCVGTPVDTTMTIYVYRHAVRPAGIIGSDGGFGRHRMAVAGLPILQAMGIPCAAVSHLSADLGDPRSIYRDGRLSLVNALAHSAGVVPDMPAVDAAERLLRARDKAGGETAARETAARETAG